MKNENENEKETIKLPLIRTDHTLNFTINKTESSLVQSNSSKFFINKNLKTKRNAKIYYQRNKTIINIAKNYSSRMKKIETKLSKKSEELVKTQNSEIIKEENKPKKYYYKIYLYGNDSSTIKKCFEHRINWDSEENKGDNEQISFIWAPISSQINFFDLSFELKNNIMVNHFEFHNELTNKLNMFSNMMVYCENNNLNVLCYLPLTILIEYERVGFIRQFNSFSYIFNNIELFLSNYDNKSFQRSRSKFRNLFYVTRTDDKKIGLRTRLFIPKNHYDGKNLWLLKAMNLNRGLGIKMINSVESCEKYIRAFYQGNVFKCVKDSQKVKEIKDTNKRVYFILPKIEDNNNDNNKNNINSSYRKIDYTKILKNSQEKKGHYKSNKIILQKYIEKPLLYNGRKFDVRLWVLLTHKMEIYLFKEGHLKATSFNYSLDNNDLYIHLTNYSVQKYSDNFEKFEEGNEISFDELQTSLNQCYNLNINVRKDLLPKIKNIIVISMESVKKIINKYHRKKCFEIFGYDFMIDFELNPFLIEINTNPGLEISSPLINKLVPRMIDDAFRLTIDVDYEIIYKDERYDKNGNYISPFHVDGYSDEENLYELIGNIQK